MSARAVPCDRRGRPRYATYGHYGHLEPEAAIQLDSQFDTNVMRSFSVILPNRDDFDLCRRYLRRFENSLRVGDAFHLAIASNHNASTFYTLDKKLLRAGKLLGLPVAAGLSK